MRKHTSSCSASLAILLFMVMVSEPAPAAADDPLVVINEIQVSTSGTDWEFVELHGAAGTDLSDLTLVGIESDFGTSAGTIDLVISLTDESIPGDGFWLAISPAGSSTYGVAGELAIGDNSFENSTATYFLVSGFVGALGEDLDIDNDGILDSPPWSGVLDAINIRDSGANDFSFGAPSVGPDGIFLPSGTFRCPDGPAGIFYDNIHDFSIPDGTPGAANTCAAPPVIINEIQVSTSGTDWEFVELYGAPGTDLSDLTLLEIESDFGASAGTVDLAISLAGQSIPADGFWLAISPTGSATYGVTGEMAIGDNSFENSTATYFLVTGFTGAQGDDLDADADGTLDSPPWVGVLDAINIRDSGASDFSYGAPSVGPDGSFLPSGTFRCPDGPAGTFAGNIHDFSTPDGTPGVANCGPPPVEGCGDAYTAISTIQGAGLASPLDGSEVATEGVVVGDFQDGKGGFFIQDAAGDGDMTTSDGIFVFSTSLDVDVGDAVRVRGTVDEYFGLTEITSVSQIWSCSTGHSVAPTPLSLPVTSLDDFEAYEGMLVTLPQALYVSEYFNFDRYGEIVLTTERQFQPTATHEPGSVEAAQLALANSLGRITLDDGRDSQNPDPAVHPNGLEFTLDNLFRGGDSVQNVTGVLDFNFGLYKVQPTQGADYTSVHPRAALPDDVGGDVRVAALNVLNYFTTLDDGVNDICGPAGNQECRGADTPEEFTRQRDKIVAALAAIDADVVGLIEIENHVGDVPTADLVTGLNDAMGAGTYAYVATGAIGPDAIRQALIYKPATVSPMGAFAVLDSSVDPRFLDDYNRPTLAQTFQDAANGGIFTVAVNHLKSKGSPCDLIGDPDTGDGSGNCNLTREAAAEALVDWLATDPTGSGDADFLIIGDLNAYDKEDPIDVLVAAGYTDLLFHFLGEDSYSYVFDGQLGYLDHALANAGLLGDVTGVTVWHINADEPDIIDYDMTFKQDAQDALYAPDAYRSSDHDPIIVGLDLCDGVPPTLDVSVSPDTLWPPNHKYVTVTATVVAADNLAPDPSVTLVSVTSNEPDNGEDDGNTVDDIVIVDDFTFKLRAERSGIGIGRVYTITYQATDACGNATQQSAVVSVPLSKG